VKNVYVKKEKPVRRYHKDRPEKKQFKKTGGRWWGRLGSLIKDVHSGEMGRKGKTDFNEKGRKVMP